MLFSIAMVGLSVPWLLWSGRQFYRLPSESPLYRAAWWRLVMASGAAMAALMTPGDFGVTSFLMEHISPWLFAGLAVVAVLVLLATSIRLSDAPATPYDH